jgi:hypothetical protein
MRLSLAMVVLVATTAAPLSLIYLGCSAPKDPNSGSCGSGGPNGGMCIPSSTPAFTSCIPLPGAPVSFETDIRPLFVSSCAVGGTNCHGDPTKDEMTTGQVFLGYPPDAGVDQPDAAMILAALVNQPSPEVPTMSIVASGDPDASYMMHKLDQDYCLYAAVCNKQAGLQHNTVFEGCGNPMPDKNGLLDMPTRDKVRRWIAQGAQNN